MPITLISNIKQANNGTFALVDSNDIAGGLYHVSTIAEMNTLPTRRLKEGMLCYVNGENKFYQYKKQEDNSLAFSIWKVGFDKTETFSELNNKTLINSIIANSDLIDNLQGQINAITGTSEGGDATTIEGLNAQISSIKVTIGTPTQGDTIATGLIKRIEDLEASLNDHTHNINDITGLQDILNTKALSTDLDSLEETVATNTNDIANINNETTGILAQAKSYVDKKGYATSTDYATLNEKINTNTSSINDLTTLIDVINGNDNGSIKKALSDAKEYANTRISDLVDTAPEALNTLNELATALGNDENFATTMTTKLGSKADKKSLENEITDRTASYNELNNKIVTLENKVDLDEETALTTYISEQVSSKANKSDVDAITTKIVGFDDTTIKDYIDNKNTDLNTKVENLEAKFTNDGEITTKLVSLENSINTINGDESTEGSMAKLKSDLTGTIATAVNNLSLSIDNPTETDSFYKINLNLSDANISSANLVLETVSESDINEILEALN